VHPERPVSWPVFLGIPPGRDRGRAVKKLKAFIDKLVLNEKLSKNQREI
jgi:hypothetical protein